MADLQKLITQTYQATVLGEEIPSELKRALKTQERVPVMVTNLLGQVREMERRGLRVTRAEIVDMTRSMTKLFIKQVERLAEERQMSVNEKLRRLEEQDRIKQMAALSDAMAKDDHEEVQTTEEGHEITSSSVRID